MKLFLVAPASALALFGVTLLACGGSVVFEEDDGSGGNHDGGVDQGSSPSATDSHVATAGPGGVGGADGGPAISQSSQGVGGTGCLFVEQSETYCYKHSSCSNDVRETECEETKDQPSTCWCFLNGVYVAECTQEQGYCSVGNVDNPEECCARFWPGG